MLLCLPTMSFADGDGRAKVDIDWGALAKFAAKRFINKHKTIQVVCEIDGKKVVVVPLDQEAGGTRLTNNINFDPAWGNRDVTVRVYLANLPEGADPNAMAFQQKWDAQWDEDGDRGPIMHHGDRIEHFNCGHDKYVANRAKTVYWGASLVFVEDGIPFSKLNEIPGIKVK